MWDTPKYAVNSKVFVVGQNAGIDGEDEPYLYKCKLLVPPKLTPQEKYIAVYEDIDKLKGQLPDKIFNLSATGLKFNGNSGLALLITEKNLSNGEYSVNYVCNKTVTCFMFTQNISLKLALYQMFKFLGELSYDLSKNG